MKTTFSPVIFQKKKTDEDDALYLFTFKIALMFICFHKKTKIG